MSTSIQSNGIQNPAIKNIVEDLEVKGIKDAKALERKDKSAVTRAGIKYIIADFLNEKTGGKFSFLRNWKENSANNLLAQMNDAFSENIAEYIKEYANKAQSWTGKSETIKLMKRFDSTNAFVELGQKSLQYCSDLLTGPANNTDPQTVHRLFSITGTLYQENKVLKPVMDQVKNDILQLAFSEKTIENVFNQLNLKFLSKPANRLIALLGIKDKVDNFFTDKILNNKDYNLNKKDLVNAEEILLYKTLSFFANYNGDKWSDDDIKKLFGETKDPFLKGLLENYEEVENLYQNSKLMKILSWRGAKICKTDFLNSILKNISSKKPQDVDSDPSKNESFVDKLEKACTKANKYLDKLETSKTYFIKGCELGIKKAGDGANIVFEIVKQTPQVAKEIVDGYNNMGGNVLKDGLGVRAEEEINEMFDTLDESTQALVKTGEKKLETYFKDKIEKIKNPEEAIQKHEDRAKPKVTNDLKTLDGISALFHELDGKALKKHMQRADVQAKQNGYNLNNSTLDDIKGLFSLTLADLQKDFTVKDGEVLRDQLNVKAESLKNEHPIQDSGYTWTATYHLAETFRHMLSGNDLQIEINGQALNYEENSDDIAKEKILALNNALNDNPGGTDGTSVVKSLSLLADEGMLLDFIPENLKTKFETNGLTLGTCEKTSQIPDMGPNIHLKINKGNPLNAEINVTWHLLNESNASQHTLGLRFATTLDLNTKNGWTGSTIEAAISSIKDLQYTFDGEPLESNSKDNEVGLAG